MLNVLAAPVLITTLTLVALDRTAQTGFFLSTQGGSQYLYENLFWVFGHPEVYILAIPGFGIVLELLPGVRPQAALGLPARRRGDARRDAPELHRLAAPPVRERPERRACGRSTCSRPRSSRCRPASSSCARWARSGAGRSASTCRCSSASRWVFNFFIGGLSGVFLSDVPSDVTTHGSFFSMAHFHYTIMGGLVFTFFAAIYYWLPKMTGFQLNQMLGKIHFWIMFIAFNSTFAPLFAVGFLGQPRRVVTYPANLQFLNDWVSVSAFVLGASMLVFLANLVWSLVFARIPAEANPWHSKSLEWQVPTPVPVLRLRADPGDRRRSVSVRHEPVAAAADPGAHRRRGGRSDGRRCPVRAGTSSSPSRPSSRSGTSGRGAAAGVVDDLPLPALRLRVRLPRVAQHGRDVAAGPTSKAPLGWGIAIMLAVVVCAGLVAWARSELARGRASASRWLSLVASRRRPRRGRCCRWIEYTRLDFGPTDGGFASVFVGWSGFFAVVVLGTMVWLETIVAVYVPKRKPRSRGAGLRTSTRRLLPDVPRRPRRAHLRVPLPLLSEGADAPRATRPRCRGRGDPLRARRARRLRSAGGSGAERRWRTRALRGGLSRPSSSRSRRPMDRLSDSLFSVHMVQHVLLLEVAAPLIVLSRPWHRLWRPFPLSTRRAVAGGIARGAWAAPLRCGRAAGSSSRPSRSS